MVTGVNEMNEWRSERMNETMATVKWVMMMKVGGLLKTLAGWAFWGKVFHKYYFTSFCMLNGSKFNAINGLKWHEKWMENASGIDAILHHQLRASCIANKYFLITFKCI